jgi:hypothetical protein
MNWLSRSYWRLRHRPWKRDVKFFWQRIARGWDDGDTLSLDHALGKLIAPRLKRFGDVRAGHPCDMTDEEWQQDIDKMVAAFEFAGSEKRWMASNEDYEKHQEGIDLFAKHFFGLWW